MQANEIVIFLNELYVYGLPLQSLSFDFEKKSATVRILDLDSIENVYQELRLILDGVSSFESHYPNDFVFEPDGCHDIVCKTQADGSLEALFVFTFDGHPVWQVRIGFKGLRVEGGISEEARARRAAILGI